MIKNGIINLFGQVLKLGSSILVMPLLIKYLGINLFGFLSWATAILAAVQLAEGGLGSGLLYFLSEKSLSEQPGIVDSKRDKILTSGIVLLTISTLIVLAILFTLTPFLTSTLKDLNQIQRNELERTLLVGALLVGVRIFQSFFWAILQSRQMYKMYSGVSTLQIIANNLSWALLAYSGEKYLPNYISCSLVISIILTFFLSFFIAKIIPVYNWSLCRLTIYQMFKYNLGVWGSNVGSILFSQGDKIIVANVLGIGTLGIYTIFTNVVSQLNQFTAQAVHPVMPLVSSVPLVPNPAFTNISNSVRNFFSLNVYISLGGSGILIIFAETILNFFLGANFTKTAILPFQLLALIYGIYTLSVTGYYITLSLGKSNKVMHVSIICSLLTLVSMYWTAQYIGFIGIILSNTFFLFIIILLFDGMRTIGISFKDWGSIVFIPLIAAVTLTILAAIHPFNLLMQVLLSALLITMLIILFARQYAKSIHKENESIISLFKLLRDHE